MQKNLMIKINQKFTPVITVFAVGILSSILTLIIPETRILLWITFGVSVIYLFLGWYLLKAYYPGGNPLLLFLIGYLYASIFMASFFSAAEWSLAGIFVKLAPVWVVTQFVLLSILRKKIPQKGLIQFIIETGLLFILSILLLVRIL